MKTSAAKLNDISLTQLPAFKKLEQHYLSVKELHMRRLFSTDPERSNRLSIKYKGLMLDYSKNRICHETIPLLCELAREVKLEDWRERMFTGDKINNTEKRAVLHTALRNCSNTPIMVDGKDVMPKVNTMLDKMEIFSKRVRDGDWKGYTSKLITDVVNMGDGGSDQGSKMLYKSLKPYRHDRLKVHFISNADSAKIIETLNKVNPETCLFIISSRTFTTQETLTNAQIARGWFLQTAKNAPHTCKHFVAVTTNREAAISLGIDSENIFELWDWVGGHYSLWSAISLAAVLSIGMKNFRKILKGAYSMDQHFQKAPLEKNMPVIMGLLGIWYSNFFNAESYAIFPYDYYLHSLPGYLEQLDMESNCKSVDRDGCKVDYATGSIILGMSDINTQHAFYHSLHHGTRMIPADFIISMQTCDVDMEEQHTIMVSNALAQTEALMRGRNLDETYADIRASKLEVSDIKDNIHHMVFAGNHPTNTLSIRKLTPRTLGMLIALYEHKIFVQGIIWNLDSFDQWDMELGEQLAGQILQDINQPYESTSHDTSTNNLIDYYRYVNSINK